MRRLAAPILLLASLAVAGPVRAMDAAAAAAAAAEVLAALKKGDAAPIVARFDAAMKGALPDVAIAQLWPQLLAQAGELRAEGPQRVLEADGHVLILQRLDFAAVPLDFKVVFNGTTGEIAGLFAVPASDLGTPLGEAKPAAAAPPPAPQRKPEEAAAELLSLLDAGRFDEASSRFDATLASMVPPDRLAAIWTDLASKMGRLQSRGEARVQAAGENDVVVHRLTFAGGALDVTTTVSRASGRVAGFFLAPVAAEATPPPAEAPFVERPITVGTGGGALEGLLVMPRGSGPFPCVVLVHGSGPQDRDETIGPNKPFRDIAWGLGERGIASIRYDKRTFAHREASASIAADFTLEHETIRDAVAAVKLAASIPGVDASRIVVAGHSLGGMALPRIAERAPQAAALAFLATPAEDPVDAILRQTTYIVNADGRLDEAEAKALDAVRTQVAAAKSPQLARDTPTLLLPLGVPASYWLYLRDLDVVKEARAVPRPLLVVQGGRDYQVTTDSFRAFQAGLAGRRDASFVLLPALNHLFVRGEGPSTPEEYMAAGRVDPEVLDALAGWIARLR